MMNCKYIRALFVTCATLSTGTAMAASAAMSASTPMADGTSASTTAAYASEVLRTLGRKMQALSPFAARVSYSVAMPMADNDVIYSIALASEVNPDDPEMGCNYMIDWQLPIEGDTTKGFTSYFPRHLYRYRDRRLQEYHFDWDSIPFRNGSGGVHRSAQFADLLPAMVGKRLAAIAADSTYTVGVDTLKRADGDIISIHARRYLNGLESMESEITVRAADGFPLKVYTLFNPGMLGEQEVTATYTPADPGLVPASEEELIELYPALFEKYRVSNYSVENLRGEPLPPFALPTITRQRYTYEKNQGFPWPMIVVLIDPQVASAGQTVEILRSTVDMLPRQTGLIIGFTSNDLDAIESVASAERPGEAILTSARTLARDCGATSFPTFLLVDSNGTVRDVILGYSNGLGDDLLQRAALLK